jgi:hypothetical protein
MTHQFKEGEEVQLIPDLTEERAQSLDLTRCGWTGSMAQDVGKIGTIVAFSEYGNLRLKWKDSGVASGWWYSPAWVIPTGGGGFIAVTELRRIHAVACHGWKDRLEKMVPNPFVEEVYITFTQAEEMVAAATGSQMAVVQEVLKPVLTAKYNVYHRFEPFTVDYKVEGVSDSPFGILNCLASSPEMAGCELAFRHSFGTPVLVDKTTGVETLLNPDIHYLKFKK